MQTIYQKMETTELDAAIEALKAEVAEVKAKGLALDMARGKPSPSQVDISRPCSISSMPMPICTTQRRLLKLRLL